MESISKSFSSWLQMCASKTPQSLGYRPDIDGLRALAIVLVLIFHASPKSLPSGFIGVDVFFVISGFLITSLLFKEMDSGKIDLLGFYQRRVRRIFPALFIVMVSGFLFGWLLLFPDEFRQLGKHLFGGSIFASNIVLWRESGYFDTLAETKPVLHFWSLAVEEQFYLLFPLLLLASLRFKLNRLVVVVALFVASFGIGLYYVKHDPVAAYFLPQGRFWEILLGSLLAFVCRYTTLSDVKLERRNVLSGLGIFLILLGSVSISKSSSFPGWWALLPTLGAALLIGAGADAWINRNVLARPFIVWIGGISYPLYLWHWMLLAYVRIMEGGEPSASIRFTAVAVAIVLSWGTKVLIEEPLRFKVRWRGLESVLFVAVMAVGMAGFWVYRNEGLPERSIAQNLKTANAQFTGPLWIYQKNDLCEAKYPFDGSDSFTWWFCYLRGDAAVEVLFIGTSFANHYISGFLNSIELKERTLLSIGTCDPGTVDISYYEITDPKNPCAGNRRYRQQEFIDSVIKKDRVPYVIIGGVQSSGKQEYIDSLIKRIEKIESYGSTVVVFYPHIQANLDTKSCFARPFSEPKQGCFVSAEEYQARLKGFVELKRQVSLVRPGVKFYNPNEVYCSEKGCAFIVDGFPVFRDQYSHFSEFASDRIAQGFIGWAKLNLPGILK